MRKIAALSSLAGMVMVAGIALSTPASAAEVVPLGGCGDNKEAQINGGYARWTLSCSGGQITVSGYVEDIGLDGDCVGVRGEFASGETERVENCDGWHTTKDFNWTHPGSIADVYLYKFDG